MPLFALSVFSSTYAQINIKEKVTITPSDSAKKSISKISSGNIWDDYGAKVDSIIIPNKSAVVIRFHSEGGTYRHGLYLNGDLIVTNALNYFTYSTCADSGESLSFGLFMLGGYNTWETDKAYVQSYNSNTDYRVYFEDYNDYDYNDLIIDVKIIPPENPVLRAAQEYYTLIHANNSELYLMLTTTYDCPPFPDDFTFNASIIYGNQYGELVDTSIYTGGTGARGQSLEILNQMGCCLIITYDANGVLPTKEDSVVIKFGSSVGGTETQYLTLYINPEPVRVTLYPSNILPGDTANVKLERWNSVLKTYEPFPAGQKFEIGIIEGCNYGEILKSDVSRNTYFNVIEEPVKFVAADSLDVDSVNVKIKAGIIEEAVNAKVIKSTTAVEQVAINKKAVEESEIKGKINSREILTEQREKFIKEKMKCISEEVKKKIINSFNNQLLSKKTNLASASPMANACSVINAEKNGVGDGIITKGPELEIIYPKEGTNETITAEPKMPIVTCKAQLKNYNKSEFTFNWKYVLSWTNNIENPPRTIKKTFEGSEPGILSDTATWVINWNKDIIGCDKDTLFVTVFDGPRVYKDTVINPYRILGTNPTPQEIREGLTIQEQIVVYLESSPKWHQFNNGYPVFGPPHGYGLMQIDPPVNDEQIWNWRVNREGGREILRDKKSIFADRRYNTVFKKYPNANYYSEKELMIQVWQLYNGGFYYKWVPNNPKDRKHTKGKWIKDNPKIWSGHNKPYGEEAWDLYESILNGNPPSNWNN